MGKLIATAQATLDGVVDPVAEWVQPDGDHGEYSFERQARSSGLVLGRKTYEGPDRRVRGLRQPARLGRGKRARARRQGNHPDGARRRQAIRLRSRPSDLPPGVVAAETLVLRRPSFYAGG